MKFKMAAAAILNLSFLSILVKWSISGGSRLHKCKMSFIYVNRWSRYCCLCKNLKRRQTPPSSIKFLFNNLKYTHAFWTSKAIHVPNFVQICATINELWAIDEIQNSGFHHLKFFLFIFVNRSISGGRWQHHCKISFIYINRWPRYCCL